MSNESPVTSHAPLSIGGRTFEQPQQLTVRQSNWLLRQLRAAGLDRAAPHDGESAQEFQERFIAELVSSDRALLLLAGFITPPGAKWREAQAEELAEFLGDLTAPADYEQIRGLLLSLGVGFLASKRRSAAPSLTAGENQNSEVSSQNSEAGVASALAQNREDGGARACSPTWESTAT